MGRRRTDKEPDVRWQVTDQVLGGLTLRSVINLHHFLALSSHGEVLGLSLEAYKPPTEEDPWWVVRAIGGETWRLQWRSDMPPTPKVVGFLLRRPAPAVAGLTKAPQAFSLSGCPPAREKC